jgi:hypothetical protein
MELVQQFQSIMDANAYLLESSGNVASAMSLILSHLDRVISDLQVQLDAAAIASEDEAVASGRVPTAPGVPSAELLASCAKQHEAARKAVDFGIALCKRHSGPQLDGRKESEDSAKLWFGLLDRLVQAQRVLRTQASVDLRTPVGARTPLKQQAAAAGKSAVKSEFGPSRCTDLFRCRVPCRNDLWCCPVSQLWLPCRTCSARW